MSRLRQEVRRGAPRRPWPRMYTLFVAPDEKPFAVMDGQEHHKCPQCGNTRQDAESSCRIPPGNGRGRKTGGRVSPSSTRNGWKVVQSTTRKARSTRQRDRFCEATIRLEQRARRQVAPPGSVQANSPEQVTCPATGRTFSRTKGAKPYEEINNRMRRGRHPKRRARRDSGVGQNHGPLAAYAVQGYSQNRDLEGRPCRGSVSFAPATEVPRYSSAVTEWEQRKNADLQGLWPTSEILVGDQSGRTTFTDTN